MSETAELLMPDVRQDLTLYAAGSDSEGASIWHLHDPLSNKYFRMEERDIQMLALLGQRSAKRITELANSLFTSETISEEVTELVDFLRLNNLVIGDVTQQQYYQTQLAKTKHYDWWQLLIRNPLFFRVPLWNPDKFLEQTLPFVRWLGSPVSKRVIVVIAFLALYLATRQIDEFFATFMHFFNWSGMAVYLLTLFVVKIFHELGHAYTAKAMGCRVPMIGVAFLVGWPVLYTDTSDAWKIPEPRKRLAIGVAGVGVEIAVAALALFLWSVAPEGSMKSAFFLLATTTWILSVAVNFNPFMRFDGYYLLTDLTGVPNMERRTFDMAKWWLREKLFGFGMHPPEPFRRWFVWFAFSVWLYRFFLFFGIALLVFNFVFRAAGIALFVAEIAFFILRPISRELAVWWDMRDQIKLNRTSIRSLLILFGMIGLLFVPWMTDVTAAAVMRAQHSEMYLPEAGMVVQLPKENTKVSSTPLFRLASPQLDHEIQLVQHRYQELSRSRASLGFNSELRSQATIVDSELRTQNQRLRGLMDKQSRLTIAAPFDGEVVDIASDIKPGDWLPKGMKIASVVNYDAKSVVAYLREEDLARIDEGMVGSFFPENLEHGVREVVVREIDFVGTTELDQLYLASLFGGDIAVRESESSSLSMVKSHYRVELDLLGDHDLVKQVVRGKVIIDGHSTSLFSQIKRRFVAVFLRETGF